MVGALGALGSTSVLAGEEQHHRFDVAEAAPVQNALNFSKIHCSRAIGGFSTTLNPATLSGDIDVSASEGGESTCVREGEFGSSEMFCAGDLSAETVQRVFEACGYVIEIID